MPKLTKQIISKYIKTDCKRFLALSLYRNADDRELSKKYGMPAPIVARPSANIFSQAGKKAEHLIYDLINKEFTTKSIKFNKSVESREKLLKLLENDLEDKLFLIEAEFITDDLLEHFLNLFNSTLSNLEDKLDLADIRPDLIIRVIPQENTTYFEVLKDGRLKKVPTSDDRIMLSVVDVKNTEKSNSGYDAEVVLYSILLSIWLEYNNLNNKYLVTSLSGIFPAVLKVNAFTGEYESLLGKSIYDKYKEFIGYIEYVEFDQVAITLRKIIIEDIIPILEKPFSWDKLDWHISKKCGLCDWLAFEPWLSEENKKKIEDKHCHFYAINNNHLSQIPFITNGMRKVLENEHLNTIDMIKDTNGNENVYTKHSKLKIDSSIIPKRANSIINHSTYSNSKNIYSMPKGYKTFTNIFITLNFDPSSRLISSISTKCHWREFYPNYNERSQYPNKKNFPAKVFFTEEGNKENEAQMLFLFLNQLQEYFEYANNPDNNTCPQFQASNYHIYFWNQTQYEELKKLIGRHIGTILSNKLYKPLIWLFGTEQILEDYKNVKTPRVSFIQNIIKSNLALDLKFDYTLLEVAYKYTDFNKKVSKAFYDPFSDYIPKERLYEIWLKVKDYQDIKDKYRATARSQVEALQYIAVKLQKDFKDNIKGVPTDINFDIFNDFDGIKLLPTDSKLWYLHQRLNEEYSALDYEIDAYKDPEELEVYYKTIILIKPLTGDEKKDWLEQNGLDEWLYVYKTTEESKNTKIKDDSTYLSLGLISDFSFLSKTFGYICHNNSLDCYEYISLSKVQMKDILQMNIVYFDRINGIIALNFSHKSGKKSDAIKFLIDNSVIDMEQSLYLLENSSYRNSVFTLAYLKAIRTPLISHTSQEVLQAIGLDKDIKGKKTHPCTMAADVLWDAKALSSKLADIYRNEQIEKVYHTIIDKEANQPNPSQKEAILTSLKNKLSIIWGPPGTGKTATASILIKVLLMLMTNNKENKTILLSAFTYQACSELFMKLQEKLDHSFSHVGFYFIKSKNRTDFLEFQTKKPKWMNLNILEEKDDFKKLKLEVLGNSLNIIIAPTAALNNFYNDNESRDRNKKPKFEQIGKFIDYALLDEASQCDVASSLSVLYGLKQNAQLVILGDHLQMPPIHKIEPPKGIEYQVGSFLEYLIKRHSVVPIMLNINYRSLKKIVQYLTSLGYDNLEHHRTKASLTINPNAEDIIANNYKVKFNCEKLYQSVFDIEKEVMAITYEDGISSQANLFEAEIVASLIIEAYNKFYEKEKSLEEYNTWFWTQGIGIVTPHKAQKILISRLLYDLFPEYKLLIDKSIDTVEKFQGSQRKFIIISFGVGDPDIISEEEEFLLNLNRTNVAISRAEDKVIILISENLVHHLPDDKEIIKTSKAIKSYVHQYCNQVEQMIVQYLGTSKVLNFRYNC